jgi:hypothetical protein
MFETGFDEQILKWAMAALLLALGVVVLLVLASSPAHAQVADQFADATGGAGGSARGGDGGNGGSGILGSCSSNSNDAEPGDLDYVDCASGAAGGAAGAGGISEGGNGGLAFTIAPQQQQQPQQQQPTTPVADLALAKTGPAGPVTGCANLPSHCPVAYVITVTNVGGVAMDNANVTDNLSLTSPVAGQALFRTGTVAATPSQGTCTVPAIPAFGVSNLTVTCALGTVPVGGGATIQLATSPAVSQLGGTGTETDHASVASSTPETNTANNSASVTTALVA